MIYQTLCTSFKVNMLNGLYSFGGIALNNYYNPDVFKIALYTTAANLSAATTNYTTVGEVVGTGYVAGGQPLVVIPPYASPIPNGTTACLSFENVAWTNPSFTANGALIYDLTTENYFSGALPSAIAVLSFGNNKQFTASTNGIIFPTDDSNNAVIRFP